MASLFINVSLKALWGLVHFMQMVAFMRDFVEWPPNAAFVFETVNEAITFEKATCLLTFEL